MLPFPTLKENFYVFREDGTFTDGPFIKVLSLDGEEIYNKDIATYGLT